MSSLPPRLWRESFGVASRGVRAPGTIAFAAATTPSPGPGICALDQRLPGTTVPRPPLRLGLVCPWSRREGESAVCVSDFHGSYRPLGAIANGRIFFLFEDEQRSFLCVYASSSSCIRPSVRLRTLRFLI